MLIWVLKQPECWLVNDGISIVAWYQPHITWITRCSIIPHTTHQGILPHCEKSRKMFSVYWVYPQMNPQHEIREGTEDWQWNIAKVKHVVIRHYWMWNTSKYLSKQSKHLKLYLHANELLGHVTYIRYLQTAIAVNTSWYTDYICIESWDVSCFLGNPNRCLVHSSQGKVCY